jgi:hypothetical protein
LPQPPLQPRRCSRTHRSRLELARFLSGRGGGARIVGIAEVSWAASSCKYTAELPTIDECLKLKPAQ